MTQQPKTILEKILEWSQDLPAWQSDALRRLFQSGELSADDHADVMALCKLHHEIPDSLDRKPVALDVSHIPSASPLQGTVILSSISSVSHVNALKVGETLRVHSAGLTVIYGDNGAGKSGYARILKRACRARDRAEPILDDVRLSPKNKGTPQAVVSASIAGNPPTDFTWIEGKPAPQPLSALSVFDGNCARHYLDGDNEVAYMPYGIDVVEGLGRLSKTVKDKLVAEAQAILIDMGPFNDLIGPTKVGAYIAGFSNRSDIAELDLLCDLKPEDLSRLGTLRASIQTANPAEAAKIIRAKINRFKELKTACGATEKSLSAAAITKYKGTYEALNSARATSELASKTLNEDGTALKGTGSSTWGTLYAAAQAFAREAYPEHPDDQLHNKDRCVLCQQQLSEGKARLERFDEYVRAEAEKAYRLASDAHTAMKTEVQSLQGGFAFSSTSGEDVKEVDTALADRCRQYGETTKARLDSLKAAAVSDAWATISDLSESPAEGLSAAIDALTLKAEGLEKASDATQLEVITAEYHELAARERLSKVKASILLVVEAHKKKTALSAAAGAINTISISTKVKTLVNESVSQALEAKLNDEFDRLGVGHIQVQLDKRVEVGKAFHKLKLNLPSSAVPTKIMSEGEQRAMALAAFLAEISLSAAGSGLIFDDPMSSLDHKHRELFAKRLVEEAAKRQIVVFTHDLMFMALLQSECAKQQVTLSYQTIKKTPSAAGEVSSDLPFEGMSIKDRVKHLRALAQEGAAFEKSGKRSIAEALLKSGYEQLRESWERAVEEVLLGGVVSRFAPDIQTSKLRYINVEEPDYLEVDAGMTRCSEFTHDKPRAAGTTAISSHEFSKDVDALEAFRKRVHTRNLQTEAARKILVAAPVAKIT